MRIQFLGATGTVTGSQYLVRYGHAQVLVDCGLFQGFKALRLRNWAPFPFDPRRVDAVILTHAHIDHSGALPLLVREGFRGPVYCTPSTRDLCRILLPDSAHLQEEQARHANRHGWSKHSPALPLYTRDDADRALALLRPVEFDHVFIPVMGMMARLVPAGHILGAASAVLDAGRESLVFSGDLGRDDDPIMRPPTRVGHADTLVLESTYGNRLHDRADAATALADVVSRTAARGGTVVIPSFAVGRAQAVLLHLHRLKASGAIPRAVPIYVDSPMATDATGLYRARHVEHRLDDAECAALGRAATYVRGPDESRALDESSFPAVIIAGSGMATGGRVLHHLKRFAPDVRSTILFTGFQAGGTRGASMVGGAGEVKIHRAYVPVRAEVRNLEMLSAHADREGLLDWLGGLAEEPRRIFLTHGEPAAADALRVAIADRLGWTATVPDYRDAFDLSGSEPRAARSAPPRRANPALTSPAS
jgi:metallo-beta-lactamase family protein